VCERESVRLANADCDGHSLGMLNRIAGEPAVVIATPASTLVGAPGLQIAISDGHT
jgi:hypothetical protein